MISAYYFYNLFKIKNDVKKQAYQLLRFVE